MSNTRYTRIQAHGTPGAFEPGFIQKSKTVGPYNGTETFPSPYKFLDANILIPKGTDTSKVFVISSPLPTGSVFTSVSYNTYGTEVADNTFKIGEQKVTISTNATEFTAYPNYNSTTAAENGEVVIPSSKVTIPYSETIAYYPAVQFFIISPNVTLEDISVNVKINYISP